MAEAVRGSTSSQSLQGTMRLYGLLERFWECAGLSVLWLLGCLPIITAGSSTVALFEVVAQRAKGDFRPVPQAFWDGFRRAPLARAGVTAVVLLALFGMVQTLLFGLTVADPVTATALQAVALGGLAAVMGAVVTALPTWAACGGRLRQTLRLAAAVGLGRPLTTLAAVLVTVALAVGTVLAPPVLLLLGWGWARLLTALSGTARRRLVGTTR